MANHKSQKKLPPRPIIGGTANGSRLTRFDYWRTGYGGNQANLDFYVAQAGEYHCKPGYTASDLEYLPHQTHLFYHIEGDATFRYKNHTVRPTCGDIIIVPPNLSFRYSSSEAMKHHWFGIEGIWPTVLGSQPQVQNLTLEPDSEIEELFVEMREVLILQKPGYALRAVAIFYELLARIAERSQSSSPESLYPDVVRNAIVYLRENYASPFNSAEAAAAVGVSPSYLRALFEKWLGESPKKFHTRHRIQQAKRLLSRQNLPVSEVAFHVGFADVHHFSRVFKQNTGVAPSEYAKLRHNQNQRLERGKTINP